MKQKIFKTNLQVLSKSRLRPATGDVFAFKLKDRGYMFGRVINPEIHLLSWEGHLVYIYKAESSDKIPSPLLRKQDLLVPPIILDPACWRRGYLEIIGHAPLTEQDVLSTHCFWDLARERYVDEDNQPLPSRVEPCGIYGLTPIRGLDDELSRALGIAPVL